MECIVKMFEVNLDENLSNSWEVMDMRFKHFSKNLPPTPIKNTINKYQNPTWSQSKSPQTNKPNNSKNNQRAQPIQGPFHFQLHVNMTNKQVKFSVFPADPLFVFLFVLKINVLYVQIFGIGRTQRNKNHLGRFKTNFNSKAVEN